MRCAACRLIKRALLRFISNYFYHLSADPKWIPPLGSQLPTQKEIARAYNVSLIVVKQARSELINAGIISSQRGSGSVVCSVPEGVSYGHTFRGITRDLRGRQRGD